MQNAEALPTEQSSEFLKGSEGIEFAGQGRAEIYGWTGRMLVAQEQGRGNAAVWKSGQLRPIPSAKVLAFACGL